MIRPSTVLSTIAVCAVGYAMFHVKYQVMQLEDRLGQIDRQIADDHEAIRVLDAEWSYLNQPARLDQLAKRFLHLTPITSQQLARFDTLPERGAPSLPTPAAAIPSAAPTATIAPVASGNRFATLKTGAER